MATGFWTPRINRDFIVMLGKAWGLADAQAFSAHVDKRQWKQKELTYLSLLSQVVKPLLNVLFFHSQQGRFVSQNVGDIN